MFDDRGTWYWGVLLVLLAAPLGCAQDDPVATDLGLADRAPPGRDRGEPDSRTDAPGPCTVSWGLPDVGGNSASCEPGTEAYAPGSAADAYAPCMSDDGAYHPFETSIGSIGRVAAFEKIVALLATEEGSAPSAQAFIDARLIYTEAEGLDSRVSRREDEHYRAVTKSCAEMTPEEIAQNPDRCVGQAQLQPLLNQAFADGSTGKDPLPNAARVEAGLLWFLYVSTHKEAMTCTSTRKDCDSSYAYYTGGETRDGGLGLARYVRAASTQAHDAVWNGILAVRCWRDLDQAVPAADLALRDRAVAQLDRGLLRGIAVIVRARLAAFAAASCNEARRALWATVAILGGVLDREAIARDEIQAASLRAELQKSAVQAAPAAVAAALDALFPCPY